MDPNVDPICDWHRLLGLVMTDLFTDTPVEVQTEVDLSVKVQYLDILLLKLREGEIPFPLPDGLENINKYNLISFKSFQETLKLWSLQELVGHYVDYRKTISPSSRNLANGRQIRLYAVSTRMPHRLFKQIRVREVRPGVYHCRALGKIIRVIVLHKLPKTPNNAMWHLFSALPDRVAYGVTNYQQRCPDSSTLLRQLYSRYSEEGINMPYTMEQFRKDFKADFLKRLSVEERLEGIPDEERLAGVPMEKRLAGVPVEERLAGVPVKELLAGVPVEERLAGVPVEERLAGVPLEERLKGIPTEELLKHFPRETVEAFLRKAPGSSAEQASSGQGHSSGPAPE